MNILIINPCVPLADPEQRRVLEAKLQTLLRGNYRPKHPLGAEWPRPAVTVDPLAAWVMPKQAKLTLVKK